MIRVVRLVACADILHRVRRARVVSCPRKGDIYVAHGDFSAVLRNAVEREVKIIDVYDFTARIVDVVFSGGVVEQGHRVRRVLVKGKSSSRKVQLRGVEAGIIVL